MVVVAVAPSLMSLPAIIKLIIRLAQPVLIVNINDSVGSFLSCAVFLGWLPSYSETIGGRVRWRVEGTAVYCNKEGQRCVCMVCDVLV